MDLRPLPFCDGHPGLHHFVKRIFEFYVLGRTAVTIAIKDLSNNLRQKFVVDVQNGSLRFGRAMTIDGVHLKMHGKNFYDLLFTLSKSTRKDHSQICNSR